MIIAVLNQKGGVGKTTLALNIAGYLASRKKRVLLIDADEQHSALDWSAVREGEPLFSVIGMPKGTIHKEVGIIGKGFDHIVIDGPPRISSVARSAIVASDMIIIPVTPSPYDIWAAEDVVTQIREVTQTLGDYKKINPFFVLNRKIGNTAIGRDTAIALEKYADIPVFKAQITQRVVFAETANNGTTVIEHDPTGQAAEEIKRLGAEIESYER